MQEVTFDLQTITPLFVAGADYRSISIPSKRQQGKRTYATKGWDLQPEIRPPSFRGLMRYWLRAVAGGLTSRATVSINDATKFEQSVFGATDYSSAINIRIVDMPRKAERFKKVSFSQEDITGRDYLLWSMAESGKGQDYRPDRWYIPEDTHFQVILSERILDPVAPQKLPYAMAAMWLLTHLDGIGSRSHRCGGSLHIQQITGKTTIPTFTKAASKEELQTILRQGLQEVRTLSETHLQKLKKQDGSMALTSGDFDRLLLLHDNAPSSTYHSCRIWILVPYNGLPWHSLKDAMDSIGIALKTYRSKLSPRERAIFGLPLNMHLFDRDLEDALKNNRRASPLSLRITQLHNGKYVGIAVLFKTPMSPIMKPDSKEILIPAPDYTVIEKWIMTAFPKALEVKL